MISLKWPTPPADIDKIIKDTPVESDLITKAAAINEYSAAKAEKENQTKSNETIG